MKKSKNILDQFFMIFGFEILEKKDLILKSFNFISHFLMRKQFFKDPGKQKGKKETKKKNKSERQGGEGKGEGQKKK